ncbi:hypothetical protein PAXRUDRAFT_20662 [Paxillus rubicundulus Ve08.2h10]|uniref:Uncharacterized protein n=1 Tax=Paxillus rubicundulus Ve08.2h10 TaxID=930991 RepID=A0A0D0CDH4_9AGAM|nr:hypothetical protein PAXRUDRAFT_20662 [Paxillus rubicundulus Ve08.2h10]
MGHPFLGPSTTYGPAIPQPIPPLQVTHSLAHLIPMGQLFLGPSNTYGSPIPQPIQYLWASYSLDHPTPMKHSKTMVPTWETIQDVLDKGMAAIDDDKAHLSSFKLEKLHLKFDHTRFTEERSLNREQRAAEQLNAAATQMFLAQAELLRLQQGMAKGQE